jgi:DNA-binding NarL/FixJ family response regulator
VERDLAEAQFLEGAVLEIPERIPGGGWCDLQVSHAYSLREAICSVREEEMEVVLLNLNLPDSRGLDTYHAIRAYAPDLPVILLVENAEDERLARRALREGAQDYLPKRQIDCEPLAHAMGAAIERSRLMRAMWRTYLFDTLTGLPNRSGFIYMGDHMRNLSNRLHRPLHLLLATLRAPGDRDERELAVLEAADAIRTCVDEGDLVGRTGASQFGILAPELSTAQLAARIQRFLPPGRSPLDFEWAEAVSPSAEVSFEQLLARAELQSEWTSRDVPLTVQ